MAVGDGPASGVGPRLADGDHLLEVAHQAVLQGYHHGDGLHHRAGLEAHHGIVERLDVAVPLFGALEVGDGFDVAGLHVHEYGAAPVGRAGVEHAVEFLLHYLLQLYVDGGAHGVAGHRVHIGPVDDIFRQGYLLGEAGHAVEQRVEGLFQSVDAVHFLTFAGLTHASHRAASHGAIGVAAAHHRLHRHAGLVYVADVEEGESLDFLQVQKSDIFDQRPSARTVLGGGLQRCLQPLAPLGTGADGEVGRHRVGQRVEILKIQVLLEVVAAEVHSHRVVAQGGGQDVAFVREDVAALGGYGVDLLQLLAGEGVPVVGVYHRGREQFIAYASRKQQDEDTYQQVSQEYVQSVLSFHRSLPLSGFFCG